MENLSAEKYHVNTTGFVMFVKTNSEHLNTAGAAGWGFSANQQLTEPGLTIWSKISFEF
jgi:iron complex outermembrane receptor protein